MDRFYGEVDQHGAGSLSAEESKHCALILRHKKGEQIIVMNGKGNTYDATLTHVSKTQCDFQVNDTVAADPKPFHVHLIIAPTKNIDRMEWLVEKLSEIGVDRITFITTQNSERRKLRLERLTKKAISAMKQSGNPFLIELEDGRKFQSTINEATTDNKLIAHVSKDHRYIGEVVKEQSSTTICIGPEGDFSEEEVNYAVSKGFQPISLGKNTLRTETAGFLACCFINLMNKF